MKKLLFLFAAFVLLLIIYNLSFSIWNLWEKRQIIVRAQNKLEIEKKENKELISKLEQAKTPQFIEEQARNKLFLVKSGENRVILPQASSSSQQKESFKLLESFYWKKWLDLFIMGK